MSRADEFEWYADWATGVSPLYERLARGVSDDPALLALAADASEGQPAPQLLLGAVHALLLGDQNHPLAEFYPTCTDTPQDGQDGDPFPPFRDFCLANADTIRDIVASRRVQTNEVGRSAILLPAFEYVVRAARGPLALIEIGTSAGLNLNWDKYRYAYEGIGVYGNRGSPVRIQSAVHGERNPPFPETLPDVVHRVGVDLNPLDVTDAADAHWLQALVIPDQHRRHERLETAIDVTRHDPPELVAGDVLDVLPDLLVNISDDTLLCVFSTQTLYQLGEEDIAELRDILTEFSQKRPIHWLSGDPFSDRDHPTYRHVALSDGVTKETPLAEYESYGAWIRWLVDSEE